MLPVEEILLSLWPRKMWAEVRALLDQWHHALDVRDDYSGSHEVLAAQYAQDLAHRLMMPPDATATLWLAGRVYDIGKIAVPEPILRKKGPLSAAEMLMMRGHVSTGYDLLRDWELLLAAPRWLAEMVLDAVRYHHERWDGRGYPEGLRHEDIPLAARIMGIADAYAAMIMDTPYRTSLGREIAIRELRAHAATQFDPYLIRSFISALRIRELKEEAPHRLYVPGHTPAS